MGLLTYYPRQWFACFQENGLVLLSGGAVLAPLGVSVPEAIVEVLPTCATLMCMHVSEILVPMGETKRLVVM